MNRWSKRVFTAFAIGIVVAMAISLASLPLAQDAHGTALPSHRARQPNHASVVDGPLKLRFTLTISSPTIITGQAITIQADIQNILHFPNNVTSTNHFVWNAGLSLGPCGMSLVGFAIFRGYHLQNDLSGQDRLLIYSPVLPDCPVPLAITSYLFAPRSDSASVSSLWCVHNPCWTIPIRSEQTFGGYWGTPSMPSTTLHPFESGVYTVVAGDEWGQLLVLHFTVS